MINHAADVIIVPGVKLRPNGTPSPDLILRTEAAVKLFQAGAAPAILLCGGGINHHTEAEVMSRIAQTMGVSPAAIVMEESSSTTYHNALFANVYITHNTWKSAILVSNAYHLRRCELVFNQTNLEAIQLFAAEAPNTASIWNILSKWLREILGYYYYLLRIPALRRSIKQQVQTRTTNKANNYQ